MLTPSLRTTILTVLISTTLYKTILQTTLTKLGIGRTVDPLTSFPYTCRRHYHPELQACEDMWLDDDNRHLYLACSSVKAGRSWVPALGKLDADKRFMGDGVYVMDLEGEVGGAKHESYAYRRLGLEGFHGTSGEGSIHVLGMAGRKHGGAGKGKGKGKGTLDVFLVNNKPSLRDSLSGSGELADNAVSGANATIELFEIEPGAESMRHVRTFAHPLIATPNNVAPLVDGSGFYITNDHGLAKTGIKNVLSPLIFNSNVVYCSNPPVTSTVAPTCKIVAKGLSFANGLVIHPSDPKTLYVPSTGLDRGIAIFKINAADGSLTKLEDLSIPYPLDNLSPSADGSIYAAAFPKLVQTLQHFSDPATLDEAVMVAYRSVAPATVLKITKVRNLVNDGREVTWMWEKVLEDAAGQVLPVMTVAVKDSRTGSFFMSGILSYFITICKPH